MDQHTLNVLAPVAGILTGLGLLIIGVALLVASYPPDLTQRPRRPGVLFGWVVVLLCGVAVIVLAVLLLIAAL
jgi:hypothetical protein